MKIVGCDYHPRWQQIAVFDTETGEIKEQKLVNGDGEAERFYHSLEEPALVGVEACGNSQWLIDLLQQLGHEVWVGDAAQIRASYVRKQKTAGGPGLASEAWDSWKPCSLSIVVHHC
jgi:transposase